MKKTHINQIVFILILLIFLSLVRVFGQGEDRNYLDEKDFKSSDLWKNFLNVM